MRAALLALMLWQAGAAKEPPVAQPEHLRYERDLAIPAGGGQACAVLDAAVFAHAAASLKDLRVFPANAGATPREVPYALTLSEAVTEETQPARVLNLGGGTKPGSVVFDLEMPDRPYSDVALDLAGHDFLATAVVTGGDTLDGAHRGGAALGSFTLFDLTAQRLSRDTTLPLQESTFRYLHVVLTIASAPDASGGEVAFTPAMLKGAEIPPSREEQILYTPVAETTELKTSGRETVATFLVPARIPVERIAFVVAPGFKGNFSRDVRVSAVAQRPVIGANQLQDLPTLPAVPERVSGTVLRVHTTEAGREIKTEQMGFPAILGANLQDAAKIEVTVENGDDEPLPIAAVQLEMRQRKLCFEAATGLTLFYGDPKLETPRYDYARLFSPARHGLAAQLGPEWENAGYRAATAEVRPFTERHPEVLWIALIAVVSVLGVVALRSSRNVRG